MPKITFIVDPGADDITMDGVSLNAIDEFKIECLSNGVVSCDWATLEARLNNHDVSMFWWFLEETERRSIAEMAIKNILFFTISSARSGNPDCEGGIGEWKLAQCVTNTIVRYQKFKYIPSESVGSCYWKHPTTGEEKCIYQTDTYNLPCNIVGCYTDDDEWGHGMCAVQVVRGTDSLDNWIVFNYSDFDIKPGNWQMPNNSTVSMMVPAYFSCRGYSFWSCAAEFEV